MTIEELAAELELKPSYLRSHWALIVKRYASYNVILVKQGRGKRADYGIKAYRDKELRWEPRDFKFSKGE